ncbi:MAG TPA: hypothetical protein VF590_04260, partial [Isosphaeraceae bacterium]
IDVDARGNSYQDLRLSLLGWWLGVAVRQGTLTGGHDVAAWVRAHLKAGGSGESPVTGTVPPEPGGG